MRNRVRIQGGLYKGRTVPVPEGARPTPSRVRETLFNWLGQQLHHQQALDLFAGSGVLGLEALSRGATVTFIDHNHHCTQSIQAQLNLWKTQATVITQKLPSPLPPQTYDLIFVDPPYPQPQLLQLTLNLARSHLNPQGFLFCESQSPLDFHPWTIHRSMTTKHTHAYLLCMTATSKN